MNKYIKEIKKNLNEYELRDFDTLKITTDTINCLLDKLDEDIKLKDNRINQLEKYLVGGNK